MNSDRHCSVVDGDKLPAAVGGAEGLCAALERAAASAAPGARYTAEVRVLSASRLSAIVVVNGKTLPQQNFAIMDSKLNSSAVERFARSVAEEIAKHR